MTGGRHAAWSAWKDAGAVGIDLEREYPPAIVGLSGDLGDGARASLLPIDNQ